MCCRIIWSERNKLVWEDGTFNPQFMASSVARMLEEYQKFHPNKIENKARPASHWETVPLLVGASRLTLTVLSELIQIWGALALLCVMSLELVLLLSNVLCLFALLLCMQKQRHV